MLRASGGALLRPAVRKDDLIRHCEEGSDEAIQRLNTEFKLSRSCFKGTIAMRWVHLAVVVLFVAATLVFGIQNRELVTMAFLGFSIRAPLAILIAVIYLLGAATGGSLIALLRKSVQASRA